MMIARKNIPGSITARQWYGLLIGLLFILLPLLSLSAGISGDEPVHYQQAEFVHHYFASGKTDTRALHTPVTNLKYYGQVFDNLSYQLNSWLKSNSPYRTRHVMNAFIGALLILFTSLIAVALSGYRAGILTVLLLFLSPRLLGHSFNNLKDIPFALGYMMALYGLVRILTHYPKIHFRGLFLLTLGFAAAFGTRAGGLLLIPIALCFGGLQAVREGWLKNPHSPQNWWPGIRLIGFLLLFLSLGYLLGILYWPYALENPLKNPMEALRMMTHYEISIRQVFNGEWIWSEKLPWYYGSKWILITSPLIVICGFVIHFAFLKKTPWTISSLLLFAAFFPILWTLVKNSNLYGGWRHLLFIYPVICLISALAWNWLFEFFRGKTGKGAVLLVLVWGLLGPILHLFRNHPLEYVYFNQLVGGTRAVEGQYETDYYFHALSPAIAWLNKEYPGKNRTIASNFPLEAYLLNNGDETQSVYSNYYRRGKVDWDFGVFSSAYIDPLQLVSGNWPPSNALHTIYVDQIPVCVILKRTGKQDLQGVNSFLDGRFCEADSLLESALRSEPENETALLYRAWTKMQLGDFKSSDSLANRLLSIHPLSDDALDLKVRNAIRSQNYKEAQKQLNKLFLQNYKFLPAYQQMGVLQDSLKEYETMARYLERAYRLGLNDDPAVKELIRAYELSGNQSQANKFRTILNK